MNDWIFYANLVVNGIVEGLLIGLAAPWIPALRELDQAPGGSS